MKRGNLFEGSEPPEQGEQFSELVRCGNVVFERIVSSSDPESTEYDQLHDEVVLLVRGHAELVMEGETLSLASGDWLLIPAGCKHNVVRTSEGALWFAAHLHPPLESS